ncbi:hypothetical protein HYR69_04500 [Candidatus Sumerlaeota bacterium]|nr:hypothetical protein [Candidatus Sumerlaeota bacterium]
MTKGRAITTSEQSAIAGLAELYPADYTDLTVTVGGPVMAADWPVLVRQPEFRSEAHDLAALHDVGRTAELWDAITGPVGPASTEPEIYFGAWNTYYPDVQENLGNDPDGDVLLGRWEDTGSGPAFSLVMGAGQPGGAGDPTPYLNLPLAMSVVIRRTSESKVAGLRDGDNPIPMTFARALFVTEVNKITSVPTNFGVYRNRGIRLEVANTTAMVPMGRVGQGTDVPMAGGGTARTGMMPIALVWQAGNSVDSWLSAGQSNPDTNLDAVIDDIGAFGPGSDGFITNYGLAPSVVVGDPGLDAAQEIVNYLESLGGAQQPSPAMTLNDIVNRPSDTTDAFSDQARSILISLQTNATGETWLIPLLRDETLGDPNFRLAGFLRVYCDSVAPGAAAPPADQPRTIRFRLAPSGVPRNGTALRTAVPGMMPDVQSLFYNELWRNTVSGNPYGPEPYGVACAAVTVQYDNVQR